MSNKTNSLYPYFQSTFEFIDEERRGGGKVFVHCQQGKSRSATIITAYLMKSANMTRNEALEIVQWSRRKAAPNRLYMQELKAYEKALMHVRGKDLKK